MDKLKENAYWIALGAIVLVLLLLAWFLVVARIYGGSGETVVALGARLEKSLDSIQAYNARKFVPTEDYERHLEAALERVRVDHNDGAAVYNDAQARFNEFFPGMDSPPDHGLFASTYHEKIKELLEAYRKRFGIEAPAPEDGGNRDKEQVEVPAVDRLDLSQIFDQTTVKIAMKEYWIVEAIFAALTRLDVGGLKKVDFPGRLGVADDQNEHFASIEVLLTVELPFSKIEDFLTQLFDNERVLFVFQGLEMRKTVEQLKPFMTLKKVTEFENRDDADRATYMDIVTEPNVSVDFTFKVLDWKGHAIIERGDLERGEEDDRDFEEEA